MNKFETQSVNVFLSDYDDTLSYAEILTALEREEYELVSVWQPFEQFDGSELAGFIENLHESLLSNFS